MTTTDAPSPEPALALVESIDLPAAGISCGAILRAFDTVRRRLAVRATGSEGAAVGYVDLDLAGVPTETDAATGHVVVSATALESGEHWQRVRYEAVLTDDDADGTAEGTPICHAIGQTVALSA